MFTLPPPHRSFVRRRAAIIGLLAWALTGLACGKAESPAAPTSPAVQEPATVRGLVLEPDGAPVGGASITAKYFEGTIGQAESDRDGRFGPLTLPPRGEVTFEITHPDYENASHAQRLNPGDDVDLQLRVQRIVSLAAGESLVGTLHPGEATACSYYLDYCWPARQITVSVPAAGRLVAEVRSPSGQPLVLVVGWQLDPKVYLEATEAGEHYVLISTASTDAPSQPVPFELSTTFTPR